MPLNKDIDWIPNHEARKFFAEVDAWMKARGTAFKHFAAATGVPYHVRGTVLVNGSMMRPSHVERIREGMARFPDGVEPPPKKPAPRGWEIRKAVICEPGEVLIPYEEICRRRAEVRKQRLERAMFWLMREPPGMKGQRVWSMIPVWEMRA